MKLNKYFMIGAMGLSLVACSDNLDDNQGVNGNASNEGTTYVAFALDFKGAESRGMITYSKHFALNDTEGVIDELRGIKGVVNPDTPPTTGENGNLSTYFTASVATTPTVVASITQEEGQEKKGNFMMSSVEEKTFYINDNITEEQALQGDDKSTNNYTIEVERVSAKVTVTAADATIESAEGTDAGGTIDKDATIFNLRQGADNMTRMAGSVLASNTYTWKVENVAVEFGATTPYKTAAPAYCLENIHDTYVQDETTYITLNTVFTPSKVVNDQGQLEDYTYNGTDKKTFYVVTAGELAGNYIMGDPITGAAPSTLPTGVEALSEAYTDGKCWFGPIWFGQAEGELGEDSDAPVVRNTWYNLQITSIKLPGSPNEPQPIPDEELEPATNVAITLEIMPWNFVSHSVVLQ